jgi:hypothetical protein
MNSLITVNLGLLCPSCLTLVLWTGPPYLLALLSSWSCMCRVSSFSNTVLEVLIWFMNLEVQIMNLRIMKLCRGWAQGSCTHFSFRQVGVQVWESDGQEHVGIGIVLSCSSCAWSFSYKFSVERLSELVVSVSLPSDSLWWPVPRGAYGRRTEKKAGVTWWGVLHACG